MIRIITSLIIFAASLGVFFTWTMPNINSINSLIVQEKGFNDALLNSKELDQKMQEVLGEYNSIGGSDLVRLNKILPDKMEAIKLIIEIESVAKKRGLLLKDIGVNEDRNEDLNEAPENISSEKSVIARTNGRSRAIESVNLDMTVAGSYKSFLSFLGDLEKSLHLIDVEKIDFTAGKEDSYDFNISAVTYWENQP